MILSYLTRWKNKYRKNFVPNRKKTIAESHQFTVVFEVRLQPQKPYEYINQEKKVAQLVVAIPECWRCGARNFTLDQLKRCKAPDAMCNNCGGMATWSE